MDEIVEKRKELQKHLRDIFPEAEQVIVKSDCEREAAMINLSADNHNKAIDRINKVREKANLSPRLVRTDIIKVDNLDSGFYLEGPSPGHLLAMLQE